MAPLVCRDSVSLSAQPADRFPDFRPFKYARSIPATIPNGYDDASDYRLPRPLNAMHLLLVFARAWPLRRTVALAALLVGGLLRDSHPDYPIADGAVEHL